MGRPGFSAADVCFTIRYGARKLRPKISPVLQKIRGDPFLPPFSPSSLLFIGFPDSIPFFLTATAGGG